MAWTSMSLATGFVSRSSAPALMTCTVVGMSAMACKKDNGQTRSQCVQAILQFRPAHAGDLDVEKDAAGSRIIGQALQQLLCRLIGLDRVATGAQEAAGARSERTHRHRRHERWSTRRSPLPCLGQGQADVKHCAAGTAFC